MYHKLFQTGNRVEMVTDKGGVKNGDE
jgi:hypothetical protein